MIRTLLLAAGLAVGLSGVVANASAQAQTAQPKPAKPTAPAATKATAGKAEKPKAGASRPDAKPDSKPGSKAEKAAAGKAARKTEKGEKAKPALSGAFGDWRAYVSQSSGKTCYALAQPKDRSGAKRGATYIFISTRPAEKVNGEISIVMGQALKEGAGGVAEIGAESFDLIAKGQNAWVKDTAEEKKFADAMRKGARLVVKVPAAKGETLTDAYSLSGVSQALDQVVKDCR